MVNLEELHDEKGTPISPILPAEKQNYLIDLDGTVCDDCPNEEPDRMVTAKPYLEARDTINKWYDQGHIITFFSARTDDHRGLTVRWLSEHGFKYHRLLLNKPRGGSYVWIDNHSVKGVTYKGIWSNLVKKLKEVTIFEERE